MNGKPLIEVLDTTDTEPPNMTDQGPKGDAWDRLRQKKEEDQARYDAWRKIAREQGLVLVQVSPRVYWVVKITGDGRGCWSEPGNPEQGRKGGYFTALDGVVVCRGNWQTCRLYVAENGTPIPDELKPG